MKSPELNVPPPIYSPAPMIRRGLLPFHWASGRAEWPLKDLLPCPVRVREVKWWEEDHTQGVTVIMHTLILTLLNLISLSLSPLRGSWMASVKQECWEGEASLHWLGRAFWMTSAAWEHSQLGGERNLGLPVPPPHLGTKPKMRNVPVPEALPFPVAA